MGNGAARSHLFFDDTGISTSGSVRRTWNAPVKYPGNPVLVPEGGEREILLFGTVLRDGGRYRMWYFAHPEDTSVENYWIGYAESEDGIEWRRPKLGLHSGAPHTVIQPERWRVIGFAGLIKDPSPCPDSERYKAILSVMEREEEYKTYLLMTSPDGIEWTESGTFTPETPAYPDTCCFTWDPYRERYVLYTRSKFAPPEVIAQDSPNFFGRAQSICTSTDFRTWETGDVVMHVTTADLPGSEIYSLMAYPAGTGWIGLHQIHRSQPTVGLVDIRASHSADGEHWTRTDEVMLPNGGPGEWDRFNQSAASSLVTVGDEQRVYYSGRVYRHGEYRRAELPDTGPRVSFLGMATIGRDRWCSLNASFDGGVVETVPMRVPAGRLTINAACRFGEIVVEAIGGSGDTVRSAPVVGDGCDLPVEWPGGRAIPFIGDDVRLRFHLVNCRLYGWRVDE